MYVRICLLAALAVIVTGQEDSGEDYPRRMVRISSLADHCSTENNVTRCSGFHFDKEGEQATFDLQTEVRIAPDGATYEVGDFQPGRALVFENCTFVNFPLRLFYTLEISELDIRMCGVRNLYWENFSVGAEKLLVLLLTDNELESLPGKAFRGASNLQFLFLNRNKLSQLEADTFADLHELQHLDLTENQLQKLPADVFADLTSLQRVCLDDNQLTTIHSDLFSQNPRLFFVTMKRNRLQVLEEYAFRPKGSQNQLHTVDLSHNPLLEVLLLNINTTNLYVRNCSLDRVNLYGSVTNVDLGNNRVRELYFPASEALEDLVLRNNSLLQLASLSRVPRLRHLDVADNPNLGQLPMDWQTPHLEKLVLRNTGLVELPVQALEGMPNLQKLDISDNNITEIDPSAFPLLSQLTYFAIHGNNWNCFSLRMIMDLLIRPNGITFTTDTEDPDFPGEYIRGIACMYRLPEKESLDSAMSADISSASVESSFVASKDEPSEVEKLRRELKAVVQHFEAKFDMLFEQVSRLNEQMESIISINKTVWNQVTLSV
ncbi:hypothetical protein KR018_002098 [Drosophila ironensis]|nr:hypothetical protein KR018_002098 [Drosophila ironensis]